MRNPRSVPPPWHTSATPCAASGLRPCPATSSIDALNPAITSATQWFERTLDDSANKRLSIPEGFLAIDGILDLCLNVVDGLVVYPKVIDKHLMRGAALHGHREHHDGRGESRRRPSGAA